MVTFPSQGSLAFDLSSLGFNSLMHLFSCHTMLLAQKQPSFSPHLAKTYTDTGCWYPGPSVSEQEGCLKLRPAVTEQAISIHHALDQPSDTALLGGQIGPTFCCGPSSPLLGNLIGKSIVIYSSSLCLTGSSPSFWIFFFSHSRDSISLLHHWFSVHMMVGEREAVGLLVRSGRVCSSHLFEAFFRKWNT